MVAAGKSDGFVSADSVYTLDEIKSRLRLGEAALRVARRQGLKVRYFSHHGYVLGRDMIDFFERIQGTN